MLISFKESIYYNRKNVWLNRKSPERGRYLGEDFLPPKLPEDFEFLPVKHSINIKKERDNKV